MTEVLAGIFSTTVVAAYFVIINWADSQLPKWEQKFADWVYPIKVHRMNRKQRRARAYGTGRN